MEVRPGYKQTDVGVIPEDWEAVRIGDLFTFKNGLNKAKQFFGHGTPIVNYMDVFGRPGLRAEAIRGSVDVSPKELNAYEVRKGDVFFTRTSETVEEIGIAAVMLDEPEKTVYSGFVLRARPIDESLDDLFKAYCFSPRYFRQQVTARASYTTRALTNGRSLSATLLARPPKPEQRAIATALSDTDALLGGLDRLIAKKRDLKQAAMQQLLTGQTRLPGFHGDWEVKRLGDVADVIDPHPSHRAPDEVTNGVPFVGIGDLDEAGNIVGKKLRLVSPDVLEEHASRYDLNDQLIGLGRVASIGKVVFLKNVADRYAISPTLGVIRGREAKRSYLLYALKSRFVTEQFTKIMSGSTRSSVGMEVLRELDVRLPPSEQEQDAIAAVLSDMDAELSALEARRDKTRALKQAMMQELLTGRTRLV